MDGLYRPSCAKNDDHHHNKSDDSDWETLALEHALAFLEDGMLPQTSFESLIHIVRECTSEKNLSCALRLHAFMCKSGLDAHRSLGNYLVSLLVEVGSMSNAQTVFDRLVSRNECSWNSLINGYIRCGQSSYALTLYQNMQENSLYPSVYTFVALLKACAKLKDVKRGCELHAEIARKGLLKNDLFVGNTLVYMYAKCGLLGKAQEVFDMLPVRGVVTWTALIAGYTQHQRGEEALNCFKQMQLEGVSPNAVTLACSLKACGSIGATDKGREIHADIERKGLLKTNQFVGNALVDMYAKCSMLAQAKEVFDKLPVHDVVSWNALIAGYIENKSGEEALIGFKQMQLEGVSPDAITFACSLKACGSVGATEKGREIHAEIARKGLLEREPVLGSALIDMYAKCGMLAKAQQVFDMLQFRDVVTWTALIAGYAQHEGGEEALNCFKQMQLEGVSPDAFTFACSLKACGSIGATDKGRDIHAEIARKGLLKRDLGLGNALVDMYAKCGMLAKAQEVFDSIPVRDVVSWNALITGYAQLGEIENVLHLFDTMTGEGCKPTPVTFVSVLNACSHAGLIDKGQTYFEAMSADYGITPTPEHHTCMVDLVGRAGQLDLAVAMMKETPFHFDIVMWLTVLAACRKWGSVDLGRQAFEQAVGLDEKEAAAYVSMYNIYADAGIQEDASGGNDRENPSMAE